MLICCEAMQENPDSYPRKSQPYAVAKDGPFLQIANKQGSMTIDPSDEDINEIMACITRIQRARKLVDVNNVVSGISARLAMTKE